MSGRVSRAREFLAKYPRATRLVLVVGVLFAVAAPLSRLIPRGLDVTFELGRNHSDFDTLRVAYLPVGQDSARALTQRVVNTKQSSTNCFALGTNLDVPVKQVARGLKVRLLLGSH